MRTKKKSETEEPRRTSYQIVKSYYSDLTSANMIYAKIVRSTVSKGTLKKISFENIPQDYFLFTAKDFGEQNYVETLGIQNEILAAEKIVYKGQPVAIIAGPDPVKLEALSKEVKITVKKETAPKEKDTPYAQRFVKTGKAKNPEAFAALFSKKNFDIKGSWTSVLNAPSCNEPNGALCSFEKNVLTICTPTQWPKHLQENVRRVFNLKAEELAIKKTVSSSPHTNTIWLNTVIAIQASLVAIKTGKPVQLILSRYEHIEFMTKKSPVTVKMRTSVKKDGLIEANQVFIEIDSGYHNPFAAEILDRFVIAANNIYAVRNLEIITKAYESNTPPVSYNVECIDSQIFFAVENQIQKICQTAGFLPAEFRVKNFERKISMPFSIATERVKESFESVAAQSDLNRKFVSFSLESKKRSSADAKLMNIPFRGIGTACGFNGIGYYGTNIFSCNQKMEATLESDGSCVIHALPPSHSTLDIWKNTVAEILELETKQVKLNSSFDFNDDLAVPESIYSNIAIMNYLLKKCCTDIQSKRYRKPLPISSSKGITATQRKAWNKEKFSGVPFFTTSFGVVIVEVEVNPYTCEISIKKINAILNIGKIALPKVAETAVKLSIQHTLSELVQDEILECSKISISFVNSENNPTQIDGLISRILPAAFTSALSQAVDREINSIPIKTNQIFKETNANENSGTAK